MYKLGNRLFFKINDTLYGIRSYSGICYPMAYLSSDERHKL